MRLKFSNASMRALPTSVFLVRPLALADIDGCDHATNKFSVPPLRMRPGFDGIAAAVFSPKDLLGMTAFAFSECLIGFALFDGKRGAVGVGVMHQIVHVLPQNFVRRVVSQNTKTGWVAEGGASLKVDAKDPLGRRIQQQPHAVLAFPQRRFGPPRLGNVTECPDSAIVLAVFAKHGRGVSVKDHPVVELQFIPASLTWVLIKISNPLQKLFGMLDLAYNILQQLLVIRIVHNRPWDVNKWISRSLISSRVPSVLTTRMPSRQAFTWASRKAVFHRSDSSARFCSVTSRMVVNSVSLPSNSILVKRTAAMNSLPSLLLYVHSKKCEPSRRVVSAISAALSDDKRPSG